MHAAVGDNLAAYHYWNRHSDRWELGVMEALEGGPRPSMLEVVTTWQQPQRKSAYEHTAVNVRLMDMRCPARLCVSLGRGCIVGNIRTVSVIMTMMTVGLSS